MTGAHLNRASLDPVSYCIIIRSMQQANSDIRLRIHRTHGIRHWCEKLGPPLFNSARSFSVMLDALSAPPARVHIQVISLTATIDRAPDITSLI